MKEPAFKEKLIAYLNLKKLDEEKVTDKDREAAKELCRGFNIYDETRAQTAPAIRVRTIKGFGDPGKNTQAEETIAEQQEKINALTHENATLKTQLEKYKDLEKDHKAVVQRCRQLESENLMLKKRLEILTGKDSGVAVTLPVEVPGKSEPAEHINEKMAEISDDEEFEGVDDEGLKKAFKENREKMAALRKEIRMLIVEQSSPGMIALKGKKKRKEVKEGAYDYSEEITS